MSVYAVFDASVFNLNLFWWQECETISDRLFKGFCLGHLDFLISCWGNVKQFLIVHLKGFYGGHLEFLLSLKFVGIASPVDLHDTFGLSYFVLRTTF